jgi:hypothetical protein
VPVSGLSVRAVVAGPGQGLGEVLSAATVTLPPGAADPGDPAAQKLAALLAQRPDLVGRLDNSIALTEASPGIYRAELPASRTTAAGTYLVEFAVSGHGHVNGTFHRSQRFSRYLRVKPATANTRVLAELADGRDVRVIRLHVTPRDRNNQRLGPGWGAYIRVTPSVGTVVAALVDNLDGSYTATVEAPAGSDPEVVIEVRGETVARGPVSGWAGGGAGRRLTAGPFAGFTFFDGGLPLDDGPVVGARWGIGLTPRLALETEVGGTVTEDALGDKGVAVQLLQNAVYRFNAPAAPLRPFVVGGIGALLCQGFAHDDASLVWDFGGGLEASLGGSLDLRFDLRDLVADDLYGAGTTHNLQVTVGLTARLP